MNVKYDKVSERIEWIDTAKVMTMLLVIIGHSIIIDIYALWWNILF